MGASHHSLIVSGTHFSQVVTHAPELRVSLQKGFLIGGDSAGGNIAAASALQARDDPFFADKHKLTGQFLREAVLLHPEAVPEKYRAELRSYEENADAPLLGKDGMYLCFGESSSPYLSDVHMYTALTAPALRSIGHGRNVRWARG